MGTLVRRWMPLILGIVVSIIFLYIGLRGLKLNDVWQDVQDVHLGWLAAGGGEVGSANLG